MKVLWSQNRDRAAGHGYVDLRVDLADGELLNRKIHVS